MKKLFFYLGLLSISFACKKEKTLFTQLTPEESGINFANRIIENDSINILTYDYVYNGGGVGIGDFNNDGLQDVFFSANQAGNRLYLNEGNMKFKDISKQAGIEGKNKWCTAAIIVDINNDGWMDIYVPASSTNNGTSASRENLLYVNQKNLTFKEMGAEYGVNDNGFSEGAAFFDYDNDGDLDLYVLTNVIDHTPNLIREKVTDGSYPNTDRLYRNDWDENLKHPVFKNVSKEAGITIEGFGLGINICDINRDGWKDIYVTNDYAADDLLYINNQNGTFTNQANHYFKHTSNSAMGNDIADINNDGFADIFALDMSPKDNQRKKMFVPSTNISIYFLSDKFNYIYQYMRNTLQLNSGLNGNFSEIGFMAGVAETDWSWTPSLADFDNDGYRDLLITNGFPKDVTDKDFMQYRADAEMVAGKEYLLTQIPQIKISNYAFRNTGNLTFDDVTEQWGLNIPSFSSGAAYGDLDNDGDLDYIVNNTNDSAFVFQNNAVALNKESNEHNFLRVKFDGGEKNPFGHGAILEAITETNEQIFYEMTPYRGYKSSIEMVAHLGLGKNTLLKEVRIAWSNGKMQRLTNVKANQVLKVAMKDANELYSPLKINSPTYFTENQKGLDYNHIDLPFLDFNIQNLMPHRLSQLGPGMAVGDINNDGLDDVFVGGSKFRNGTFLIQSSTGAFEKKSLLPAIDSTQKKSEDTGVLLFDADSDGNLDLYIVSGGNEDFPETPSYLDRLYRNTGTGSFELVTNAMPMETIAGSCVRAGDYDADGDLDLFIAGRNVPTKYPKGTSSTILRNDSKKGAVKFTDVTKQVNPTLIDIGMVCDALWTDYDNDNDLDLIVTGELMAIRVFKNEKGRLGEVKATGLEKYSGLWNSINGGDFDNDGDIDYIVGNVGLNALFKGTEQYPAKFLSGDFDKNGNYDVIPFIYLPTSDKDKEMRLVPMNGKEDISKQFNALRMRYVNYSEYTKASFDNLLTPEERKAAEEHTLNYNASVYIENLGDGKFSAKPLPMKAQVAPINGMVVEDFNADGNLDVLLVGNNYGNEILVGKFDASNGLLLVGNGKGNFTAQTNTGFMASGDAKSLVAIRSVENKMKLLVGQNQGKAKLFDFSNAGVIHPITMLQRRVNYQFNNKTITREVYYGASYLSQSTRGIFIPKGATNIQAK